MMQTETAPGFEQPQGLGRDGFCLQPAATIRPVFERAGLTRWEEFAHSWEDLGLDQYMADGGRYRKRRFAAFNVDSASIERKPHQPHYQSHDYNPLNGGVERWFSPVEESMGQHPALLAIIRTGCHIFTQATPPHKRPALWHTEVHQFRIEAHPEHEGRPTPEGLHRDGVDWVMVVMVRRCNILSGQTDICDLTRAPLGSFTLTDPLDTALVDDSRVYHGVTPIHPQDPQKPAFRDVLVVTFRH